MKFRLRDRIALAIYSLLGFVAAALFAGVGYLLYTGMLHVQLPLLGRAGSMIAANVLAVIMLIYSAFMLRLAFKHKPKKDKNSVTVATSEQGNGEVRVSVQALDALVKQAVAGNNEGVADIKTSIVNHDDSISVKIDMSLHGDAHIPNITMLLQSSIKSYIEEFSGIAVRDVFIMVKTIVPVLPQLAIEEKSAPVVLEENEHREMPAPQLSEAQTESPAEEAFSNEEDELSETAIESEAAEEIEQGEPTEETTDEIVGDEEAVLEDEVETEEAAEFAEEAEKNEEAQEDA